MKYLPASVAAAVDKDLMSSGGFSIDQLMELAGLAVAQAVYKISPPAPDRNRVLVLVGPGNNGGDGLVAARHLFLLGFSIQVYYPKRSKGPLFDGLQTQLRNLDIPFLDTVDEEHFSSSHHIVDALFGFSFKPPVREPFPKVLDLLAKTKTAVTSVDIPSGWHVDNGPEQSAFFPSALVSLTAPKPAAKFFKGRHFVGGRFISNKFAQAHGFEVPPYEGIDQVVEVPAR